MACSSSPILISRWPELRLTQESEYLVTVRAPNHAPLFDDVRVALAHHEKNYQLVEIEPAISSCRDLGGSPLPNIPIACFVGSSDLSHLYSRGITDRAGRCILPEATVDAVARWTNLFDRNQGWSIGLKPVSITGGVAMFDVPAESLRGEVRDQAGKPVVGASVVSRPGTFSRTASESSASLMSQLPSKKSRSVREGSSQESNPFDTAR